MIVDYWMYSLRNSFNLRILRSEMGFEVKFAWDQKNKKQTLSLEEVISDYGSFQRSYLSYSMEDCHKNFYGLGKQFDFVSEAYLFILRRGRLFGIHFVTIQ